MGSSESTPRPPRNQSPPTQPPVIRIERNDVPEAYMSVQVTEDVVRRANAQQNGRAAPDEQKQRLSNELEQQRAENARLRKQMEELTLLQQRQSTASHAPQQREEVSAERMQELKQVFADSVDKVQKIYFSYRRENACADNEKEITTCLAMNPNKVLNCHPLYSSFVQCVEKFRSSVLQEKPAASDLTK